MADVGEILTKVTDMLQKTFDIEVIDKDIEEDILRPAFVIDADEITKDKFGLMDHISFRLHVYYFAPSIHSGFADLYGILDNLMDLFAGRIKINDTFNFTIEEQQATIYRADMAVEFVGLVDIVNPYIEDAEGVDMLDLDVKLNKEGE